MGKQAKRDRQKANREAARLARERSLKRSKQKRQALLLVGLLVGVFALLAIISLAQNDEKKNSMDGKVYQATITTNLGTITTLLDPAVAPKGVDAFVKLAKAGDYNGIAWARVAKDFVIQSAEPKGTPDTGVGEAPPKNIFQLGDLGYAKAASDPPLFYNGVFFIVSGNGTAALNAQPAQYAYFGTVKDAASLAVAQKIMALVPATGDGAPTAPATIDKVTITTIAKPKSPPDLGSTATTAPAATTPAPVPTTGAATTGAATSTR